MSAPTKALVVHQPHAALIALGIKTIETRPAAPNGPMRPEGVRGLPGLAIERGERIAIVAGTKLPKEDQQVGAWTCNEYADDRWGMVRTNSTPPRRRVVLHPGAVVCTVVVAEALPMEPCPPYSSSFDDRWEPEPPSVLYLGGLDGGPWAFIDGKGPIGFTDQLPYGDYEPGRFGWLLADVERTTPIPCKGKQGVFRLPQETTDLLSGEPSNG